MFVARTFSVLCLTSFSVIACQPKSDPAAPLTDTDRRAITEAVARLDQAVLAGNPRGAVALYADDAVVGHPNAPQLRGRAAIQKFFEGIPRMSAFKQDVVEVEGRGDVAYTWVRFDMAAHPPGAKVPLKDTGKLLAIWRKQPDGSWLVSRAVWNSDLGAM
jgi:uncharacterized protein (TIGR02246 family)